MNVKVLFLFLIIFLISITSVSAGDDVLSTDENDDMLSVDVGSGNFAKLSKEINYANNISLTGDITRDSQDNDIIIHDLINEFS